MFKYYSPNILNNKKIDYKKIIHRTLFWDKEFPKELNNIINDFNNKTLNFIHILWKEKDLLLILNNIEKKIYFSYKKRIQKADFGRYIILLKFGGIYADLDIKLYNNNLNFIINKLNNYDFLAFEEKILKKSNNIHQIRKSLSINKLKEYPLRIANYFMISRPNSEILINIIKLCIKRSHYPIHENYDILFTTGPDVISTIINETFNNNIFIFRKPFIDKFIKHTMNGHWK